MSYFLSTGQDLNDGTEYIYYVVANNAGGASADSSEVSAKPIDTVQGEATLRFQDADSAIVSESGTTDDYTIYVSANRRC